MTLPIPLPAHPPQVRVEDLADRLYTLLEERRLLGPEDARDKAIGALVVGIRKLGFEVSAYEGLLHVYERGRVEVQVWRGRTLIGLTSKTPEQFMSDVYYYLFDRQITAEERGKKKLLAWYEGGLEFLKKRWKVRAVVSSKRSIVCGVLEGR